MEAEVTIEPGWVLDFDLETVAAGFADPNWVPQRVTCIAWSWLGQDKVDVRAIVDYTNQLPLFLQFFFMGCQPMIEEFVSVFNTADAITGHNIARFDLGIFNAELMRLELPLLEKKPIIDTMNLKRPLKGYKKGQDVISDMLGVPARKKPMNWAQWQKAYATMGWEEIKERCAGDVVQHKMQLARQTELNYLR